MQSSLIASVGGANFDRVFDVLGSLEELRIFDLGCGSGIIASELAARGATVSGLDSNPELLAHAAIKSPRARNLLGSIERPDTWGEGMWDLAWSSFPIACTPDPNNALKAWAWRMAANGRIVLTEAAGILQHEPLDPADIVEISAFTRAPHGVYDFDAGLRLQAWSSAAGLVPLAAFDLSDDEIAFQGAAALDVLEVWSERLDHMPRLSACLGPGFKERFLSCLANEEHRSAAKVRCIIAGVTSI